jgi:hypothetical protein
MRDQLREHLLSQQKVPDDRLDKYRLEVRMLLEKKEKAVSREKKMTSALWVYLVLLSTAFLAIGGMRHDTMQGLWFGILACFWFAFGSVFLFKYFMNRDKLEILKELKGIELHLVEIQHLAELRSNPASKP